MIVRCGSCQIELEVAGPGEFACPACGTRNVVRGSKAPSPFELPDLGAAPPAPQSPSVPGVNWVRCPACSYRFAVGDVETVSCPSCSSPLNIAGEEVRIASN